MPTMPPTFRPRGAPSRQEQNRQADARRGSPSARGYDSRWVKAARSHRRREPLCRYCAVGAWGAAPRDVPATLVDHLYPHRRFEGVFWMTRLWVSACADCHSGPKQAVEREGRAAIDALARRLGLPTLADLEGEGAVKTSGRLGQVPAG